MADITQTPAEDKTLEEQLREAFEEAGGQPQIPEEQEPQEPDPTGEEPATEPAPANEPTEPQEPTTPDESQPTEPATEPATTEPAPAGEEPKLILGKFKTHEDLEKAYVNLEKMASQKAQRATEEQRFTSPTEFDNMVAANIEKVALNHIETAISKIADPEQLKEATAALAMYRRTGDLEHIERARGYLDRGADRRLETDLRNAAASIKEEMGARRDDILLEPVKEALMELEEEDSEWMQDPIHQQVLTASIKLNRQVNVRAIKEMINEIGENAVKKYIAAEAKKKAVAAETKPNVSVKAASAPAPKIPPKAFKDMTMEEQLEDEYRKKFGD